MITNTDHLREIAEDSGLDTPWSASAWPEFLKIFHAYMIYREQCDYQHKFACDELMIDSESTWRDVMYDLYCAIMDEPELYY